MQQEEISFKLPISSKDVVIKGYVSGAIDAEIQSIVQEGYELNSDINVAENAENSKIGASHMKFSLANTLKANQRAIELMVISLGGDSSNVYKRVMDLPVGDTDFITKQINQITEASKLAPKVKKN